MGLFKKRDNEVPKLPELPPLPDLPEIPRSEINHEISNSDSSIKIHNPPREMHNQNSLPELQEIDDETLPEIPSHPLPQKSSNQEIKSSIIEPPKIQEIDQHESFNQFNAISPTIAPPRIHTPEKPRIQEIHQNKIIKPLRPHIIETEKRFEHHKHENIENTITMPSFKKNDKKPIFIRIDKFEKALENFQTIKDQVREMASLLTEIKEKRAKEDAELNEWEHELDKIKAKIMSIDSALFEKVD